jgi:hypothetical protein
MNRVLWYEIYNILALKLISRPLWGWLTVRNWMKWLSKSFILDVVQHYLVSGTTNLEVAGCHQLPNSRSSNIHLQRLKNTQSVRVKSRKTTKVCSKCIICETPNWLKKLQNGTCNMYISYKNCKLMCNICLSHMLHKERNINVSMKHKLRFGNI